MLLGEHLSLGKFERRKNIALLILDVVRLILEESFRELMYLFVVRPLDGIGKRSYGVF